MKFAFSRPTATGAEQQMLFDSYAGVGYSGLQLKAGQYRNYIDEPQRFLNEWGGRPGVASGLISMAPLGGEGDTALRKLIGFAGAVGAERIIFVQSDGRGNVDADALRAYAQQMSELGRVAQDAGVALSLHHHHNQPVMTHDEIDCFFASVADGTVGLTVDTAHLVKSGVYDVAGVIRDFASVIDNLHLKDFAGGKFQILGHGDIDFAPIFDAVRAIGYDGWACADEESGGDLQGGLRECYQFMHTGLAA